MTYDDLKRLLEIEDIELGAAEVHGLFCGRLAGGERLSRDKLRGALMESLATEEEMIDNAFDDLAALYDECLESLKDDGLGFRPLLPSEEAPLAQRVSALAQWCQAFIAGLGDSGLSGESALSDDALGALKDMTAIAQVNFEGDADEDDEGDFTELEEFVRVTAMLIFAERGTKAAGVRPSGHTLH